MPSVGLCAQLACIWETTARNPGNAHRTRDFDDVSYVDFLASAAALAPVLEVARCHRVGASLLNAIKATKQVTPANTNLGIVLLLVPLATVADGENLRTGVERVLGSLDVTDARLAYAAIRLANPAGLGKATEQDVQDEPTQSLREVMALAAEHDLIARQYANGFHEVFTDGVPLLRTRLGVSNSLEELLIFCHLHWLARYPDSLIARKRGLLEAQDASHRADAVLQAGWPDTAKGLAELVELDRWLRMAGRGRNPGTTSDLVTACLFVALRETIIPLPASLPWTAEPHHV